jgi:hypothetical protein
MKSDHEYHLRRARTERDIAYRAIEHRVSDAHMRLSALHLERALVLQDLERSTGEQSSSTVTFRKPGSITLQILAAVGNPMIANDQI